MLMFGSLAWLFDYRNFLWSIAFERIIDIASPCWSPPWSVSSVLLISRDVQTWILENLFLIKLTVSGRFFFSFFFSRRAFYIKKQKKKNKGAYLRKVFFQQQHGFFETFVNNGIHCKLVILTTKLLAVE